MTRATAHFWPRKVTTSKSAANRLSELSTTARRRRLSPVLDASGAPDHSGRHVLSLSTTVGYTGTHTPIYENFFAGGFATLRGFDFRGASPMQNGVEVGGRFQWLNSLQYLFPVSADDMLHGVAFCDFGTVEPGTKIQNFRVAPGIGARITVPAMGPAPNRARLCLPRELRSDRRSRSFSFSMGFSR